MATGTGKVGVSGYQDGKGGSGY